LHAAGERDLRAFGWFEAPPAASLEAAERLLLRLGATTEDGAITPLGRRMLSFPLHPRLARLVLEAEARGAPARGALLAALLGEREVREAARTRLGGGPARVDESGPSDLLARMDAFERGEGLDRGAARAVARARDQIARARDQIA